MRKSTSVTTGSNLHETVTMQQKCPRLYLHAGQ